MKTWNSTGHWKAVDFNTVETVIPSNQVLPLDRSSWPSWASSQTERIFVFAPDEENRHQVPGSTVGIVVQLLAERYDPSDVKPYNINFYLIAESTGGQYYMSPPIRPVRVPHHSSEPITIPESFGPPPF
jgi:hypothetical protein